MYKALKIILKIALALGVTLSALVGYAYFIEPNRLVVNEVSLSLPHWSKELDGFKVVAVSDIHAGSHTITEERLRELSQTINAQNPDIVVLLGDYVSQVKGMRGPLKMPIEAIAENLKEIRAKYGVYVIIGNHDWWYDEKRCREEFEKVGFKVLENEKATFQANGKLVNIIGIEDYWKRETVEIDKLIDPIEPKENVIGLTHNPDSFDKTPESLSLLIAGHTHGGQIYIPFIGAPIPVAKQEYVRGHVVKEGRNLFVTVGVGTSGPPFRFLAAPEIAVLTIHPL